MMMDSAALLGKLQSAIKGDALSPELVAQFKQSCGASRALKSKGNTSSKTVPGMLAVKLVPALQNKLVDPELLNSDPAGDCAKLLELASTCVAAFGTLNATALPKTKKAWHIHTLVLNLAKILRKFKRSDDAKACGHTLLLWMAAAGRRKEADKCTVADRHEHLRIFGDAIVLQLKTLTETADVAGLVVVARAVEGAFQDAARALSLADKTATRLKAVISSCTSMAEILEKRAAAKGPGQILAAIPASVALRCAAMKADCATPATIAAAAAAVCQRVELACGSGDPSMASEMAKGSGGAPQETQDLVRQLLTAAIERTSELTEETAEVAQLAARCVWWSRAICGAQGATTFLSISEENLKPELIDSPFGENGDLARNYAATIAQKAASLRLSGDIPKIKGPKALAALTKASEELAELLPDCEPAAVAWAVTSLEQTMAHLAQLSSGSMDVAGTIEQLCNIRVNAMASAEGGHPAEIFHALKAAGSLFGHAQPRQLARCLAWFERAFDYAVVRDELDQSAFDELYKCSRVVFNEITQENDPNARQELAKCLQFVCASAQQVDSAGDRARRASGVLSSLFKSLAVLCFNVGLYPDAVSAAGKCVAFLPADDLADHGKTLRPRVKDFVFYCAKAARKAGRESCTTESDPAIEEEGACVDEHAGEAYSLRRFLEDYAQAGTETTVAVLQLQMLECQRFEDPTTTLGQQYEILGGLLEMIDAKTEPSAYAQHLVGQARIVHELGTGKDGHHVELCAEAIQVLKEASTATATLSREGTFIDDLASAYAWSGICARDAGEEATVPFETACRLWLSLLDEKGANDGAERNRQRFADPERTRKLLHTLASLFGLLGRSKNQVLVHRLIELLNRNVRGTADDPSSDAVTALLASTGHLVQRLGYVSEAEVHFRRAEQLPGSKTNHEFLLFFSQFQLAQGDVGSSQRTVQRVLQNIDDGNTTSHAKVAAVSAEVVHHQGQAASATALAKQALRLRAKDNSRASSAAGARLTAAGNGEEFAVEQPADFHTQWDVMSTYFDSLQQTGELHLQQGFHEAAVFYFTEGLKFAQHAGLKLVQTKFLLALSTVACDRHEFTKCGELIDDAQTLISNGTTLSYDPEAVASLSPTDLMTLVQIARSRGNLLLVQQQFDPALAEFAKAERLLIEVTDVAYVQQVISHPKQCDIGSPVVKQLLKAVKLTKSRLGGGAREVLSPLRKGKGKSKTAPAAARAPQADQAVTAPKLSGLLATTKAMQAWIGALQGKPPSEAVLAEILELPAQGQDAALLHYLVGSMLLQSQSTHVDAAWQPGGGTEDGTDTATPVTPTPPVEVPQTHYAVEDVVKVNYCKWKVAELKAELSSLGLPVSGKKAQLIARLEDHFDTAAPTSPAAPTPDIVPAPAPLHSAVMHSASGGMAAHTARATGHFKAAFEHCRGLPHTAILRHICFKIALITGKSDAWQTSFYLHTGQGITTSQDYRRRAVGKRLLAFEGGDDLGSILAAEPRPISDVGCFQEQTKAAFPADCVVLSISVDQTGTVLLLSRIDADKTPLVHRVACGSTTSIHEIVAKISEIIKGSDDVISTCNDIRDTADEDEKATRTKEWWARRDALDTKMGDTLSDLEDDIFGSWKTFFLGKVDNAAIASELRDQALWVAREIESLAEKDGELHSTSADPLLCERLLDGMIDGVLSEAQLSDGISEILGAAPVCESNSVHAEVLGKTLPSALAKVIAIINEQRPDSPPTSRARSNQVACTPLKTPGRKARLGARQGTISQSARKAPASAKNDTGKVPRSTKKSYTNKKTVRLDAVPKLSFETPSKPRSKPVKQTGWIKRHPVCLVLDSSIHGIPFEALAVLEHRPVCRMPSADILLEQHVKRGSGTVVDDTKTFYVLNPSNDLGATQQRFEEPFSKNQGWTGIVGKPPTADDYTAALTKHDTVVYCGHGAGEQFFKGSQLRDVPCTATMLLMGCSSGRLRGVGDFEPTGIALQYLLAGAPAVVSNLWDVTDGDIDSVTAALLEVWHGAPGENGLGLLEAVSIARTRCRMKYLNGAAPIVYGLNVWRS